MSIGDLIRGVGYALYMVILARVVVSWIAPGRTDNSIVAFIIQITEPILAPIRRILPRTGMIDLAPLAAIIILTVVFSILNRLVP